MVRDEEIKRLTKYAQGLGFRVVFSDKRQPTEFATWDTDEIVVYKRCHATKIEIVLSLVHEIGHAAAFVRDGQRKLDDQVEQALDTPEKKNSKKKIWQDEIEGSQWWHSIYEDCDLKFPLWLLEAQMELDLWAYEMNYKNGEFPTVKERLIKKRQLKEKHRKAAK